MRALRFGLSIVLVATVSLAGSTAYAGNEGLAHTGTRKAPPTREFDKRLNDMLTTMIASTQIDSDGEVIFDRAFGDQRFIKPNSGRYWQINGEGQKGFSSRSLWDRKLKVSGRKARAKPLYYNSDQFPGEPLRVVERTVRLPGSDVDWQFVIAQSRDRLD